MARRAGVWLVLMFIITSGLIPPSWQHDEDGWKKKDIRDYNDADLERLLDQWEEGEEPLPEDELPEWDPRRPQPQLNMNDFKGRNPEDILKMTKKGKTLMAFVKVTGNPSKQETDQITSIWQTGLWNSHIHVDRYPIEDNRAIFMFKDGSQAWEAKDFLIEQERCLEVNIDDRVYHGKYSEGYKQEMAELQGKGKKDAAANKKGKVETKSAKKKREDL